MNCKRCDVEMLEGVALRPLFTPGADKLSELRGQTLVPAMKAVMSKVLKCPACGYSRPAIESKPPA